MKVEHSGLDNAGATKSAQDGASYVMVRRNYKGTTRNITSNNQAAKRPKLQNNGNETTLPVDQDGTSQPTTTPAITTQNSFDILAGIDGTSGTDNVIGSVPTTKKVRLPPITVVNNGTRRVRELLTVGNIPQNGYHMKAIKVGVQLVVKEEQHYQDVISVLKDSSVEFFTYTAAAKQPVKVILSGLPYFSVPELEEELVTNGVQALEVKIFSQKKVGNEESTLYLLYFEKGRVRLSELQKIKALFNIVVKWRYFTRKPSDAVQCHRCQRYGHGMRNCHISPLCVKCGEKHLSTACTLPAKADLSDESSSRSKIRCANCSGNHTANYRGCASRKNYLQQQENRLQKQKQRSTNKSRPNTQVSGLWPTLAPGPVPGNTPTGLGLGSSSRNYSDVLRDSNNTQNNPSDLFTISEFLCLARDLFARLNGCRNKHQQFLALSELMIKYIYNV